MPHTADQNPMKKTAKLCGAKTRAGGSCRRHAMQNGRCRLHGGLSPPPGPAHPRYIHGGRSRRYALVGALSKKYAQHLGDLDYMGLRDEMALISTQIDELVSTGALDTQEGRSEVRELVAERRKLSTAEAQRVKLAQEVMTIEQARAFGAALLEAVRAEAGENLALVERIQNRTITILRSIGAIHQGGS